MVDPLRFGAGITGGAKVGGVIGGAVGGPPGAALGATVGAIIGGTAAVASTFLMVKAIKKGIEVAKKRT